MIKADRIVHPARYFYEGNFDLKITCQAAKPLDTLLEKEGQHRPLSKQCRQVKNDTTI